MTADHADVVVIGGGIIGCAAAFHLTRLGIGKVMLLDRNPLASAATSRAAALLTQVRTKTCLMPLVRQTFDDIAALQDRLETNLDLRLVGGLHLARSAASLAEQSALAAIAADHALPHHALDRADAIALAPWLGANSFDQALFFPDDAFIDPYRLASAYAEAARKAGAVIRPGCAVTGLKETSGAITGVSTPHGDIAAACVIDAAGAWANLVARHVGIGLPMAPVRSQYWISGPNPLFPPDSPIVVMPDARAYARPEVGGLLFGLRERQSVSADPATLPDQIDGFAFADDPDGWASLEEGADALRTFLPALDHLEIRHYVNGLSTYTPDGLYVAGAFPGLRGFVAATGCCGAGIAGAGGLGKIAATAAAGQAAPWNIEAFRPNRFGKVNPFDISFQTSCAAARSSKRSG